MSNKAEQAAWDWAIENKLDPYSMGRAYAEGYEQAEKDLILTWQDIKTIVEIADKMVEKDVNGQLPEVCETEEGYYMAILEEFNKTRK